MDVIKSIEIQILQNLKVNKKDTKDDRSAEQRLQDVRWRTQSIP